MHIVILQGAFFPVPPIRGGAIEKLWHSLGSEFARQGHLVTHISRLCDGLPAAETIAGVRHLRVEGYDQPAGTLRLKWRDLLYSRRACRVIPPADVIITNSFWSPLLLRKRTERLCVIVERMPKGQMRLYRHAWWLRASTIAVAEAIKRDDSAAKNRVIVIPNPLPHVPPQAVAWDRKERVFLFVGRLHREKGIEMLLQAFLQARARPEAAAWKLRLVGPSAIERGGSGEPWVHTLRQHYASPAIEWIGPVYEPARLDEHFAQAAAFVYPTTAERGEAMPVAPLEAMAWGCVPIVSCLACFADYIRAGENGFVFDHQAADPAAALSRALIAAASANLRPMGEAALRVRETHSPTRIAAQFLEEFSRATLHRAEHE